MKREPITIGIDLGTTFSCVGVYRNNKVDIIPNELGQTTTPSVVCFENEKIYVGELAKDLQIKYPYSTIYDSKRLIGRFFYSEEVQNDMKYWPFKVIEDSHTNRTLIEVDLGEKGKKIFKPEEISAMILKKLKEYAEQYLDNEVKDAVITVPAYFTNNQKQLTKDAGKIAGLNVLRIIQEPTAAAIAYGLDKKETIEKTILVFDFGGGTFDVSLLNQSDGYFDVLSLGGDNHLGGNDINQLLVDFCIKHFENETGFNISNNKRAIVRLNNICEKVKKILSFELETNIDIDNLFNGEDFHFNIQRNDLEELCHDLFHRCIEQIDLVLEDANVDKKNVDEIVLIGGSTKIPKVKEIVKNYFNKKPYDSISPDEAVAYGAAINAYIIKNPVPIQGNKIVLLDRTPFSLGIEIVGKKFSPLIPKGTYIPHSHTEKYCTWYDNQKKININIYEGEYEDIEDNIKLGSFILSDIPLMKARECIIQVTFEIDVNSILYVKAVETSEGISKQLKIINDIGIMDDNEICTTKQKIEDEWRKSEYKNQENLKEKIASYEKSYMNSNSYEILCQLIITFENFIGTFNEKIIKNKTGGEKYETYIKSLFNYYKNALLHKSIDDRIKNQIREKCIYFINLFKDYDIYLFVNEILSIFKDINNFYYYFMIQILKTFLEKTMELLLNKKDNFALNELNEAISFILKYNLEENIKKCTQFLIDDFYYVFDKINYELKRLKAENIIKRGEEFISLGDKENNENEKKEYYNLAIDKYREAYSILFKNFAINQTTDNYSTLNRRYSNSLFSTLQFKQINDYKEDNTNIIPESEGFNSDIILEAKCISKIVYIIYRKLENKKNIESLLTYLNHSTNLIDSIYIDKNIIIKEDWYKEILKMKSEMNIDIDENKEKSDIEMIENKRKKYPEIFKEIEEKSKKKPIEFIKFILEKHPYEGYIIGEFNFDDELKRRPGPFLLGLHKNYHPDNYPKNNEQEKVKFCIMSVIDSKITNIIKILCPNKLEQRKPKLKKKKK